MTKRAKSETPCHVQLTFWCFLSMAITTLSTQSTDAASDRSWTNVWSNNRSEAGNVDEEALSSQNVTTDVKSSTQIISGHTEQQNVGPDDKKEAVNKLQTDSVVRNSHMKENQSSDKEIATDSTSSRSELVVREQDTAEESSQSNKTRGTVIKTSSTISIKLWNQIYSGDPSYNVIKVKCQSLKDGTVITDFDLKFIAPNTPYTWTIEQVNDRPNLVKCVIYWDHQDVYMAHVLYQDSYSAHWEYSHWYVEEAGLYGYEDNVGFDLLQSWQKEL